MDENLRKLYEFQGLKSIECGAKIESEIRKIPYVKSVIINSVTSRGRIELERHVNNDELLTCLSDIVNNVEKQVVLKEIQGVEASNNLFPKNYKDEFKRNEDMEDYDTQVFYNEFTDIKIAPVILGISIAAIAVLMNNKFSVIFSAISYLIIGVEVLQRAIKSTLKGRILEENFIITLVTMVAFLIGEYYEALGVMLLYKLGKYLQIFIGKKVKSYLDTSFSIKSYYKKFGSNGEKVEMISPEAIRVNDIIQVKPGDIIPVDGIIVNGSSQVDMSPLIGGFSTIKIKERDEVLSGTINETKLLEIKVTKSYKNSIASRIQSLVKDVTSKKTSVGKLMTKFTTYYTGILCVIALGVALVIPIFISDNFDYWIYKGLVFFLISCSYVLVSSIQLSFSCGIVSAAKNGIIIKNGNTMGKLSKVETVVFEKTGILTEGVFTVTKIVPIGFITDDLLIEYAAYAEIYSTHPIAKSIINAFKKNSSNPIIDKGRIKSYKEIPGKGVKIYYGDRYIYAGNSKLMDEYDIQYEKINEIGTIVYVAINQNYIGYIVMADKIKATSPKAINDLKAIGVKKVIMITSDNKINSDYVGKVLSIDEVYSDMEVNEKMLKIEELKSIKGRNSRILFVGDENNDELCDKSYLGLTMGNLKSFSNKKDDFIDIITDDPTYIAKAIKFGKNTQKLIIANILITFILKAIIIYLNILGFATMWCAAFIDVIITLISLLNIVHFIKSNKLGAFIK
ncbi:heavy metal translocating P-type ATPase [Clostridium sp.]|uniref:heavy metal translocating P-type ATPase n=1 Tax=Clostridium sp. TaxID=1506 RepID=UPI002FCBE7BE